MPFEVRNATGPGEEDPHASVLSDDDWRRVISLARRHGFDPRMEYRDELNPGPGESGALALAASQELAVALSEALRRETAPGGEGERGIRVGPPGEPDLQIEWAKARGVGEVAESGPVVVTRLP